MRGCRMGLPKLYGLRESQSAPARTALSCCLGDMRQAAREMSGFGLNGGEGGIRFHAYPAENANLFALFVTQFVTLLQLRFTIALLSSPAQSILSVETDAMARRWIGSLCHSIRASLS